MVAPPNSQVAPIPIDLPFRIVSRTIGQGAYAFIRKAAPKHQSNPVIAVKFINKDHAFRHGHIKPAKLKTEIALHSHLGKHKNIIQFLSSGEDPLYTWIAMELADGGDLFDKIEADEGVGENIAHFYFTQLINAVGYMHSKGIAHRDLKPENMLLDGQGNLKLADFGLAALFRMNGSTKHCTTVCGSPPYIAPEIVTGARNRRADVKAEGYAPNISDIWSCGVVLFVLLVGNTPWDEPTERSWEFKEYVNTSGRTSDELWQKLPAEAASLLRGMLKLDPKGRFSLDEVRTHPWFTRPNAHLNSSGTAANPIKLATQMLESLRIDFSADAVGSSQPSRQASDPDAMDIDTPNQFASTQPETPLADTPFDWERPPRVAAQDGVSASQPAAHTANGRANTQISNAMLSQLTEDPTLSQFSQTPSVPLSRTQAARRYADIVPAHSLARFFSPLSFTLLLPLITEALHRLGVPVPSFSPDELDSREREGEAYIRVKTVDGRHQGLNGTIVVERYNGEVNEVRFVKLKGDPLEWRRFFKKITVLSKDGVLTLTS